jgi:AraC family transcriptional regulator
MEGIMSRIGADVERAVRQRVERGEPGGVARTALALGDSWIVHDVVCTSGPDDRPYEERHAGTAIAVVLAGTFQYRSGNATELLTPGSVLLGNDGECFECGHQHAAGDRCVAFHYTPQYFERVAFDAGGRSASRAFRVRRLPPLRDLSRVSARAMAGVLRSSDTAWDELALELAATVAHLANSESGRAPPIPPSAESRVTASVRAIERHPGARHTLESLARGAGLSEFHYLRTFQRVTGVTPHQFILRTRLREAAARLAVERARVVAIAFDVGFNDLSTFNRTFRAEFGMSPREFRRSEET